MAVFPVIEVIIMVPETTALRLVSGNGFSPDPAGNSGRSGINHDGISKV